MLLARAVLDLYAARQSVNFLLSFMVLNLEFLVHCNCNWFKHLVIENGTAGVFLRFREAFWATSVAATNRRSARSSLGRTE